MSSTWEEFLSAGILQKISSTLSDLSFTRLVWLTENMDSAVLPFLKGELDHRLKGLVPPMPLKQVDAEQYMLERNFAKPPEAP